MDSTEKPTPAGADDLLLTRGDDKANGDYERIVREELARVQERLAQLAPVGMTAAPRPEVKVAPDVAAPGGQSANVLNANITAFRPASVNGVEGGSEKPSHKGGGATRVLVGLLVAGAIVGGGAAWAAYGDVARPLIATWTPQLGAAWSQISERFGLSGGPAAAPVPAQATAAPDTTATAPTAPTLASASQEAAAPPAAAAPADVGQMLQSMARDIASLQQGIEQLKAGQDQMAHDNAKLAEQLKVSQEQLTRVAARAAEASLRPKPLARPPVVAAHRPMQPPPLSTLPPPQTIAPPPQTAAAQAQLQAEEAALPGAPRPPKPVP